MDSFTILLQNVPQLTNHFDSCINMVKLDQRRIVYGYQLGVIQI